MILRVASANLLRRLQISITLVETPRPQTIGGAFVGGSAQIAKHPHCRPESANVGVARKDNVNFDNATRKAKLFPALYHTRRKVGDFVFPLLVDVVEPIPPRLSEPGGNFQKAIFRRYAAAVVKLQGSTTGRARVVVAPVKSGPHGIVAVLEGSIFYIKLVAHDL